MARLSSITRHAVLTVHDLVDDIAYGHNMQAHHATLSAAVAHLETQDAGSLDVLFAKAIGSQFLGHTSRELELPRRDAAVHHLRAARYASELNDNELLFEAVLGAEACLERDHLSLARKALIAAAHIDARRSNPSQHLRLISREGGMLYLLGQRRDSLRHYQQRVVPLALQLDEPVIVNRAIAVIAYCDIARATGRLDQAWESLEDEAVASVLEGHNLIAFQRHIHRGFLLAEAGDIHLAAGELRSADDLRLRHSLTPRLVKPLHDTLAEPLSLPVESRAPSLRERTRKAGSQQTSA